MSNTLAPALEVLTAPGNEDRFVLLGSIGRASLLEDSGFPMTSCGQLRDIDVVDTEGRALLKYEFRGDNPQSSPIDAKTTGQLHPSSDGVWHLSGVEHGSNNPVDLEVGADVLGISRIDLPLNGAEGYTMLTFGICAHIAIATMTAKHRQQKAGLVKRHATTKRSLDDCSCPELAEVYRTFREATEPPRSAYRALHRTAERTVPGLFGLAQHSVVGSFARKLRGTKLPERVYQTPWDVPDLAPIHSLEQL